MSSRPRSVAQLGARTVRDREVAGSNPATPTFIGFIGFIRLSHKWQCSRPITGRSAFDSPQADLVQLLVAMV